MLLATVLASIKHSPVFILPLYTAYILDVVIPARDTFLLLLCAIGMASTILLNIAMHPLYIRLYSQARREVSMRLRNRLIERIQQLVFAYHDKAQGGRLHSKVMQDVEKLDQFGQIVIEPITISLLTAITACTIIGFIEPMFLLIIVFFLPLILLQHRIMNKRVGEKFSQLRVEQEKLNAEVSEMIVMLPLSRAHATEKEDLRRVTKTLGHVRDMGVNTDWLSHILGSQIWGSMQLITITVVCTGAWLVMLGKLSIGQIVMFITFVGMTVGNVAMIFAQLERFFGANEAMQSISEVLSHPEIEQNEGKPDLPPLTGALRFENVSFTYPETTEPVLRSLNVDVQPNQTIALVGGSGAGKTTFVKLLLGFYSLSEGRILVDGHPLDEFNLRSFRRQIGIVTQETFLFNGTILQNLAHGLGDTVSTEQVEEAARQANAHDFIGALADGYQTEIGDRGLKLSGGQKQRLAIARALLRQPRLLLLDEATSSLDSQSERAVQEALETLMRDRTTFVIAHRLSTIRHADRILVFDKGQIVEDGHHDVLFKQNGIYARLVALQSIA